MYKHILTTMQLNVQAGRIIMTNHAVREMKNDSLTFPIMTTRKIHSYEVCRSCGAHAARRVKRDELYGRGKKAVIIQDVPMVQCDNCGMTYLEPQIIMMIDEICAQPEKYAAQEYRPVAKIA